MLPEKIAKQPSSQRKPVTWRCGSASSLAGESCDSSRVEGVSGEARLGEPLSLGTFSTSSCSAKVEIGAETVVSAMMLANSVRMNGNAVTRRPR